MGRGQMGREAEQLAPNHTGAPGGNPGLPTLSWFSVRVVRTPCFFLSFAPSSFLNRGFSQLPAGLALP